MNYFAINIIEYLKTTYPELYYIQDFLQSDNPDNIVLVRTVSNKTTKYLNRGGDYRFSLDVRNIDRLNAYQIADNLFELCKNRYHITLPGTSLTIEGNTTTIDSQEINSLTANEPIPLGVDDQGRYSYIVNIDIYY